MRKKTNKYLKKKRRKNKKTRKFLGGGNGEGADAEINTNTSYAKAINAIKACLKYYQTLINSMFELYNDYTKSIFQIQTMIEEKIIVLDEMNQSVLDEMNQSFLKEIPKIHKEEMIVQEIIELYDSSYDKFLKLTKKDFIPTKNRLYCEEQYNTESSSKILKKDFEDTAIECILKSMYNVLIRLSIMFDAMTDPQQFLNKYDPKKYNMNIHTIIKKYFMTFEEWYKTHELWESDCKKFIPITHRAKYTSARFLKNIFGSKKKCHEVAC